MKKNFLLLSIALSGLLVNGQSNEKYLNEVIQLTIPREGGANGAGVVWHPLQKKYYSAVAGNISFCLSVYDINGKLLSPAEQETLFDVRGIWYNPNTKKIQMNGYNDFGWAEYILNMRGLPSSVNELHGGMNQPGEQSVGAYDFKENLVYFLNQSGRVEVYDAQTAEYIREFSLKYLIEEGKFMDEDEETIESTFNDEYNGTTLIYTGLMGLELGVLNHYRNRIELYSLKTGYLKRKLKLPSAAPMPDWLNFSFANGIYFLFDKEERVWHGYK